MKIVNFPLLLASSLAAISSPVGAADPDYPPYSAERAGSSVYRACIVRNATTVGEGLCLSQEYSKQKVLLDATLRDQMTGLSGSDRTNFIAAQRAWVAFRNANCKIRAAVKGSGATIFYYGCMVRETIMRRVEFTDKWDY